MSDICIPEVSNELVKPKYFADIQNKLGKRGPEIMVSAGVVGVVVSTVLACKATLKAPAVIEAAKGKFADIAAATELEEYTEQDRKQDLVVATSQTAMDLIKLYGVPTVLMAASIFSIYKGHGITLKRNAGLTSALSLVSAGYKTYRSRVAEVIGSEKEEDLYYGRTVEEEEYETTNKKGEVKIAKKKVSKFTADNEPSVYARWFDDASTEWQNSAELNLMRLKCLQSFANDKLRLNKVLFLNEVYDMLGLPRSQAGQVVGWAISEHGDNYVDFGIFDGRTEGARMFVNGEERNFLLDFNVDGVVYDLI